MLNSSSATAIHQRRASRSNSTSSSVVTVKKASSLSSRTGARRPQFGAGANSPEPFGGRKSSVSSNSGRNGGSRSRPSSALENTSGSLNVNINRWSDSSTSSLSGIENELKSNRKSSSSKRVSAGPTYAIGTALSSTKPTLMVVNRTKMTPSPKASPQKQNHPVESARRINHVAQAYYGPKSSTPSTATSTPGTSEVPNSLQSTGSSDYFGETWKSKSTKESGSENSKGVSVHYSITKSPGPGAGRPNTRTGITGPLEDRRSPGGIRKSNHTRNRDRSAKGSADTTTGSSISSTGSDRSRRKGHRSPTQKTMLAKALTKANTAVLLDNARNFAGATEAYAEACDLLQQVMARSSELDDRTKLSAIKDRYSQRIAELKELESSLHDPLNKALPDRPMEDDSPDAYYEDDLPIMTSDHSRVVNGIAIPPRLESMLPANLEKRKLQVSAQYPNDASPVTALSDQRPMIQTGLAIPMQPQYMPSPLSPRRPPSPPIESPEVTPQPTSTQTPKPQHVREASTESTSWLDTIDESASSTSSSRLSSLGFESGHGTNLVDEIEAEFDAAMNAAVEAAYDDEREKTPVGGLQRPTTSAKPAVQPTQSESGENADHPPASQAHVKEGNSNSPSEETTLSPDFDQDAEEERLLDEMTRGYGLEHFHFDNRSKSALPRQSDSSGFSGRTWGSSVASTTHTSGTTLSTLAEGAEISHKQKPSLHSPVRNTSPVQPTAPELTIPPVPSIPPPPAPSSRPPSAEKVLPQGVRDRRLSGQNAKQLKIETFAKFQITNQQPLVPLASVPRIQVPGREDTMPVGQATTDLSSTSTLATPMTSIHSADSVTTESPATSLAAQGGSQGSMDETTAVPPSPSRLFKAKAPSTVLRKNVSSSSLRVRNLSVNTAENTDSPITPVSATFPAEGRKPFIGIPPPVPTPTGTSFHMGGQSIGGMYLFDDQIGLPTTPRSPRTPNLVQSSLPSPLEHCPESFLLRPFWLMRTIYQTIAHPRGGYLTTKLFVPRDIWKVKSVKLKSLDEKIAQCDLLTAALLKLASVDNLDADAVLEELQSFESVMDQVRTLLHKKLGGDVGLSGTASLFKNSPSTDAPPEGQDLKSGNPSNSAKNSFASSWRKLRSKSSGATLNHTHSGATKDGGAASQLSMPSVPITTSTNTTSSRHHPRRLPPSSINLNGMGPNANYMSSLAKLFDAAQVLDQIARQVEDPGLKCSSQTHVGLELSVRNAAEFFAFYVLRFVVADLGTLLDKFVKRGTEWVLA